MKNFMKMASGVDVLPLLLELHRQPELWDRNDIRLSKRGPHWQTHDIWLRYKDETENKESGNYRNFGDEHDGIWYPAYYALPSARKLIFDLMARVEGERLGGVFIYTVPAGKKILPHTDKGWHVDYYDKFNICLQSNQRAAFVYDDETMTALPGDVHRFVNNRDHAVVNDGGDDHIVMTVCIRTHQYEARFKGEEKYPFPTGLVFEDFVEKMDFSDGKYRRSVLLDKAQKIVGQHAHEFDHDTEITSGKARMWKNKVWAGDYRKGDIVRTVAKCEHAFLALEDNTEITCIWPEGIDAEAAIIKETTCRPGG